MSKVIFINPFKVPKDQEDDYLIQLEKGYEHRKQQSGFVSGRLYRAVSPDALFHFINVTEWQSEEHLQTALKSQEFKAIVDPKLKVVPHYPAIYQVIRT